MWRMEDRFEQASIDAMTLEELEEQREVWGQECNDLEEEARDAEQVFEFFDNEVHKRKESLK